MLSPKRIKYRKKQRGTRDAVAHKGNQISFGEYGLMALEPYWITNRQIEAARVAMTRHIKRGGKVWIRIFPDMPYTKKPAETRQGNGKGAHVESLIQVCYDLSSERTLKREVDSIIECAGELKCSNLIIVTMNEERIIEKNGYKVKILPIYKF